MSMIQSRRSFLRNAALGSAIAACPLGMRLAFADTSSNAPILVVLLLRGGMDGLKLIAPTDDADYIAARTDPAMRVLNSGSNAGLALAKGPTKQDWRLNPLAAPLMPLYADGQMAFIDAAGLMADTRSHFEAQELIDTGTTDVASMNTASGWLTRYSNLLGTLPTLGAVSIGTALTDEFQRSTSAIAIPSPNTFSLRYKNDDAFLRTAYGRSALAQPALQTLNAVKVVTAGVASDKTGDSKIAAGFGSLAQLINMNVGLRMAVVTYGGWDTHVDQAARFDTALTPLAKDLAAFWNAIPNFTNRVRLVTLTDFGRRVVPNADNGTDHGHGQVMMAMGAGVSGGRILANWKGLAPAVLDHGDKPVTTDCRQVLWEMVADTLPGHQAGDLFAGFTSSPIGLMAKTGVKS